MRRIERLERETLSKHTSLDQVPTFCTIRNDITNPIPAEARKGRIRKHAWKRAGSARQPIVEKAGPVGARETLSSNSTERKVVSKFISISAINHPILAAQ